MPLPEYVQAWLTEFDESSEPVNCSMISLILHTRLAERESAPNEVKAIFRSLAPLEFHIRPRGGSPWNSYFAPKHDGTDPTGEDPDYPLGNSMNAFAGSVPVVRRSRNLMNLFTFSKIASLVGEIQLELNVREFLSHRGNKRRKNNFTQRNGSRDFNDARRSLSHIPKSSSCLG